MKEIKLLIPDDWRLGQALMNAYRDRMECLPTEDGNKAHAWDIWEEDTEDVQKKLDDFLKDPRGQQ